MRLLVGLILLSKISLGQDTLTTFFDADWKKCKKKDAVLYRKTVEKTNDYIEVYDYYMNGQLKMIGGFLVKEKKLKHGKFLYYYESGKQEGEEHYDNGLRSGLYITYYRNAQVETKGQYLKNKKDGEWTYWTQEGKLDHKGLFKNGKKNGLWEYFHKNGKLSAKEEYSDGEYIAGEFWNENGISNKEGKVEVQPEFPGGEAIMMEWIQVNLVYPDEAVAKEIQGIVYVQFVVEQNGTLSQIKVVRGVHQSLDDEAVRVIANMPLWKPGLQHNRLVRCRFTLPIQFRIVGKVKKKRKKK